MKFRSFFLLALLFLQSGFTQEENSIAERIEQLEEQRGFAQKKGQFQGIAEGDLLYWKADVDGVAYETTTIAVPAEGGLGNVATNFKTRTPHFSYDPGFRLSLGFQSAFDLFDVRLVWTRFYTTGHDKAKGTLVPALTEVGDKLITLGIGLINELTSIPNSASVKCRIKENILDLQLARGIDISHYFTLRPYFGVRGVWSDVHWNISIDRTFLIPGIFDQDSTRQKVKNDFHAAGGLIGLDLDWKMPYGLGINVRGAGALVYGLSEEKTRQAYTFLPAFSEADAAVEQNFRAKNSCHTVKGILELFAGIFWDSRMSKQAEEKKKRESPYVRLFAGYEFQQWPSIAQKTNAQQTRQRERFSLGFQGFTGGARLIF